MLNLVETEDHSPRPQRASFLPKDVEIIRRMRIFRKITREDAAKAIDRSVKVLERFENGRQEFSIERKKKLIRRYRFTWEEFLQFSDGKSALPDLEPRSIFESKAAPRIQGRKYQKQITKVSRVLKILRKVQGWTQPQAAEKCGWSRSCVDHLENGRVDIGEEKVAHILRSYSCTRDLFDELLEAPMLRDEVVEDCLGILTKLDNDKLRAVKALLDNFR